MSNIVLSGSLDFLSLADLFQLLGTDGSNGILSVMSRYVPNPGLIYFENGNPVNAAVGSAGGIDAVYQLFGWVEGKFEFSSEDIKTEKLINLSRMEIILNGLRMLDDNSIEKLGIKTFKKKASIFLDNVADAPFIKGSLVDYMYVVDEEEFFDGEKIVEKGKHGNWVWVILEGVVDIIKETPDSGIMKILRLGEGSFVGNMSSFLLRDNVRGVTAVASGNVQLGVLDAQRLSGEYACMPSEIRGIVKSFDKRLLKIIENIGSSRFKMVVPNKFKKDKILVVKEGKKYERMNIISQGEAYVVRRSGNDYLPLATLGVGDFFGYFPLLDMGHEPYSASIFGSKDLKVKALNPENLQKEYAQLSSTFKKILKNVAICISGATLTAGKFHKKSGPKEQNKIP